jgi:hypothetical protein
MPEESRVKDLVGVTSLRRHYPDQVPRVETTSLISADLVRLPQLLNKRSFKISD